jgi:hypothetical protein
MYLCLKEGRKALKLIELPALIRAINAHQQSIKNGHLSIDLSTFGTEQPSISLASRAAD